MSIYINHSTNDISTNAGARVTSGGNTVITANVVATDAAAGIVELATTAEVQTGTDTGRVPSVSSLRGGLLVSGTPITTTSGTSHDFTSIPSWAKKITFMLSGVSTNGTSLVIIQAGTGGTPTTTGYTGASGGALNGASPAIVNLSSGFGIGGDSGAGYVRHGTVTIIKITGNTWIFSASGGQSDTTRVWWGGCTIALAGALDMLRLTTAGGTDTFDAGSVNIIYE